MVLLCGLRQRREQRCVPCSAPCVLVAWCGLPCVGGLLTEHCGNLLGWGGGGSSCRAHRRLPSAATEASFMATKKTEWVCGWGVFLLCPPNSWTMSLSRKRGKLRPCLLDIWARQMWSITYSILAVILPNTEV